MNALKMIALVCAAVLIGVLVPTSGQVEAQEMPEIEVLEAEPDHGVVRVGDFIIEGTPDHVEIRTEGRGLVAAYDFEYRELEEGYEVTAYDAASGKEIVTVAPNPDYRRAAGETTRAAKKIIFDFDGVPYVSGKSFGVPYSHVDYESVGVEPQYEDLLDGRMAYHRHISQKQTEELTSMPPVVAGAAIGGVLGLAGGVTAIIGATLGAALGQMGGTELKYALIDETGSFWIVSGINDCTWKQIFTPGAQLGFFLMSPLNAILRGIPNYVRIGSILVWDVAGLGNPDDY